VENQTGEKEMGAKDTQFSSGPFAYAFTITVYLNL
jgi:hypothetical protein